MRNLSNLSLTNKIKRLEAELKGLEPMVIHVGEVMQLKRKLRAAEKRISRLVADNCRRKNK